MLPRSRRTVKGHCNDKRLDHWSVAGAIGAMVIYKILRAEEWAQLNAAGATQGAPIDIADGYVHFSTAEQVAETAAKHFAGVQGLMLLALDTDALDPNLKWEESRGGALFPHLYSDLRLKDVIWSAPLPCVDGAHQFPERMA